MFSYLKQSLFSTRLLKFGVVGASGVIVNMGSLYVLTEFVALRYFIASIIAIELSILSNFSINHLWTWRDRHDAGTVWTKMMRYHIGVGVTAFLGNYIILIALTELAGMHYLLSNMIGIGIGTLANYVVNGLWTFGRKAKNPVEP